MAIRTVIAVKRSTLNQNIEAATLYNKTLGCLLGGLIGDAMKPSASVTSILQSAVQSIVPLSGHEMLARIEKVIALARPVREHQRDALKNTPALVHM